MKTLDKKVFTLSNFFSLLRLLLLAPIAYLLTRRTQTADWWALGLMILAALTDIADGNVARILNQKTDLGRILDPLADKICITGVLIILVFTRDFPLWFLLVMVIRDLTFLYTGLDVMAKKKVVLESKISGKLATIFMALTIFAFTIRWHPLDRIFLGIALFFLIFSSIDYGIRYWQMISS